MRWASLIWDAREAREAMGATRKKHRRVLGLLGLTGSSPHPIRTYLGDTFACPYRKAVDGISTNRDGVSDGGNGETGQ